MRNNEVIITLLLAQLQSSIMKTKHIRKISSISIELGTMRPKHESLLMNHACGSFNSSTILSSSDPAAVDGAYRSKTCPFLSIKNFVKF